MNIVSPSPPFILPFAAIRAADLPFVGGKGANLGEMAAKGFPVPPGFCVTTAAFRHFLASDAKVTSGVYAALDGLRAGDVATVRTVGEGVRARLMGLSMPDDIAAAIIAAWRGSLDRGGEGGDNGTAFAVRSSATAEDLPGASFAGQQDTYLGVRGEAALLDAVKRCWVSLFTDRAILYRGQNGFAHPDVALSVVVQRMVESDVSGILFTADPLSGNRVVASIDAGFGLGEALVGGLVTADLYRIDQRSWQVIERRIAYKQLAIRSLPDGGTEHVPLAVDEGSRPSLTDGQAIALARLGARVAAHYGAPQDIEWCIDPAGAIWLVQSRPITTLFPIPTAPTAAARAGDAAAPVVGISGSKGSDDGHRREDSATHIFISFSHIQVMTDPITPLGRDAFRLVFPFAKDDVMAPSRIVAEAAGRLFVDVAPLMAIGAARRIVPRALTIVDGQMAAALGAVVARPEVVAGLPRQARPVRPRDIAHFAGPMMLRVLAWLLWRDVDGAAERLAGEGDDYIMAARSRVMAEAAGAARIRAAEYEVATVFARLLPTFIPVIAGALVSRLLLLRLAGAPADVAELLRGLQGNITTDMDLAVGDLADLVRGHPTLVDLLTTRPPADALTAARNVDGGAPFLAGLDGFLARYGMRGGGEIDLGRPRWTDDPSPLIAVIAGNLAHAHAGEHRSRHAELAVIGAAAVGRLTVAARHGPLGWLRARVVGRLARVLRGLMAVREHPKFILIRTFGLLRGAIAEATAPLVTAGRLEAPDDVWLLDLAEIRHALADPDSDSNRVDLHPIVAARRAEMARFAAMRPPRVITSDGEVPEVTLAQGAAPAGALVGTAASAGIVEGIAHVITDPGREVLQKGEILIAPFTDPGWTPLFINAAGLVMEVGGLMTHGSVVAREYGIPAVVGVPDAVTRITTGMRVRVHGDGGWVEVISDPTGSSFRT